MTVIINELEITTSYSGGVSSVSLDVYKSGVGNRDDRWLAAVLLDDFDFSANTGKRSSGWRVTGRNLDFTNTLA